MSCLFNGEEHCRIWPSRLGLSLHAKGESFEQQWLILSEGGIPLPGNKDTRPMDVKANGGDVPVIEKNSAPSISLRPGEVVHDLKEATASTTPDQGEGKNE